MVKNCSPIFRLLLRRTGTPPQEKQWNSVTPIRAAEIAQSKRLLSSTPGKDIAAQTFGALDHRRYFYDPTQHINLPYRLITRQLNRVTSKR